MSSENSLSLNPNDFQQVADWEDGQTYSVTLKVKQSAPGEFEVLDVTQAEAEGADESGTGDEAEAGADDGGGEGEAPPAKAKGRYSNPAVAQMMQE